jgi:hypothetical protein
MADQENQNDFSENVKPKLFGELAGVSDLA